MAHNNYMPPSVLLQNKGLLQNLQNKRQKMETISRHFPVQFSVPAQSLAVPLQRSQLMPSFTNNPQLALKPKPIKPDEKSYRIQMNEAIAFAERSSSGYYIGNASPFGNLLIPAIPRLEAPKDGEFRESRLPRDQERI